MEVNLVDLQNRLNASRDVFQRAFDRYDKEGRPDGAFIVTSYLQKFQDGDPNRAEIVAEIAKDTKEEIDGFGREASDLMSKVAAALQTGNLAAYGATIDGIGDILAEFSKTLDAAANRLSGVNKPPLASSDSDLEQRLELRKSETARVGESVIKVLDLATAVCNLRCETLRVFRTDNLEVSKEELIRRLQDMLIKIPAEELFDRFRELAKELLAEYLKKVPFLGWVVWVAGKVRELSEPKAGTDYGDTDIMLTLLPTLRKDQEMIIELDRVFKELVQ